MQEFRVLLNADVLDTVFYNEQSPDEVKRILINQEGFPQEIEVQRVYFTREEYLGYSTLDGSYSKERAWDAHCRYYSQFDCGALRSCVPFKIERLLGSTDKYFNDLPLKAWDNAVQAIPVFVWKHVNAACSGTTPKGYYRWSLSDGVCLLKQAARNMVQEHERDRSSTSSV